jgi:hypothetical protein
MAEMIAAETSAAWTTLNESVVAARTQGPVPLAAAR